MFSTLVFVGFVFGFAWVQQLFLNRLIASDTEYLKELAAKNYADRARAMAKQSPS
jgi:hypothetical protein